MITIRFDPFEDRLARDIRNALSETIIDVFEQMNIGPAQKAADGFLHKELGPIYDQYIAQRLEAYAQGLEIIRAEQLALLWDKALVLWDLGLFFEVHEMLEYGWLKATGTEKLVLQAMIRAAGMYIKLHDQDNARGAAKMASKAVEVLEANRHFFSADFPLNLLLDKLHRLDPVPPKLRTAGWKLSQ